ncbi:hypothetical protein SAMN05216462_1778 [Xylanibacter ruminicola]|uniref:Uncharacterized protein n=1 Tax=Xylanibacter ruminicola TaxID=839 RepID=A0A1H4C5J2_XYLRU|nr:hypothetical protein [Xylanibacter ruminicola]SEA55590.1 hypothetical protein SAMN05216462_1778 [Xylanibacter ruminicola]
METENKNKPASPETINSLIVNMLLTLESSYKEMHADLRLVELLKQDNVPALDEEKKGYIGKILRVHANVCYTNLCLCAQLRASLKAKLNVEKQYIIRRSVVTLHETYKYLFGFTEKLTLWKELEVSLKNIYPAECQTINEASQRFLQEYAQEEDGTLRDVAKHFSDDPTEFFESMESVTERSVTERVAAAGAFLQPIHNILIKELKGHLGAAYDMAMGYPMPHQVFDVVGNRNEKVDAFDEALEKYSGIVNQVMHQISAAKKVCSQFNVDITQCGYWDAMTKNNIGLHILYIYLDTISTFRAFSLSETFAEIRLNLAYFILSVHEGFKKLYGFDAHKRDDSFWNRSIKTAIQKKGDDDAFKKADFIEKKLEVLAESKLLQDEDMIVALTHVGTNKKRHNESAFLVLDYFRHPVAKEEMNSLTEFLQVMNDIVRLYNDVIGWESKQIQTETEMMFAGYYDKIDEFDKLMKYKISDPEVMAQWEETSDKLREMLKKLERI